MQAKAVAATQFETQRQACLLQTFEGGLTAFRWWPFEKSFHTFLSSFSHLAVL
jgi:hypothetical protein